MSTALMPYVHNPANVSITNINGGFVIDLSRDSPDPQATTETESVDDTTSDNGSTIYVPHPGPTPEVPRTIWNIIQWTLWLMHSDILRTNFRALLGGTEPNCDYPRPYYCYYQLTNGWYTLRPHFRRFFTDRLVTCAGLIAAALNDCLLTDHGFVPDRIPVSIPVVAIQQSEIFFPTILLFLSNGWTLSNREFSTESEIKEHVEDILNVLRLGMATFAKIISTSMRAGYNSVCNPGAGIGMDKDEFIRRAGPIMPPTSLIEAWIDSLLDNDEYRHDTDYAAAKIFTSKPFAFFILVDDGSTITLLPYTPIGFADEFLTHRMHITPAELGQRLAMVGF